VSSSAILLVVTIAFLTVYVVGVGGATATAIRIRERFRQQKVADSELAPRTSRELVLSAPALPAAVDWLRRIGWLAFIPALVFAVFVVRDYPWVTPVAVVLMVAINAFYFTAMQNMGEQLTFTADGFTLGRGRGARPSVRRNPAATPRCNRANARLYRGAASVDPQRIQDPPLLRAAVVAL